MGAASCLQSQVRDAIYAAIRLPLVERHIRHEKHWKYVSNHTVQFWAKVSGTELGTELFAGWEGGSMVWKQPHAVLGRCKRGQWFGHVSAAS